MVYRRFGRTNLQMPVFSCGGMRYQHKWQDVPLTDVPADSQANLEATIRRAVELGINHIETARGYGSSERQLGCILPSFPRQSLIVQTKIAPTDSPDEFLNAFDESLERLRLSHVDLLALHGINNEATLEQAIRKGGCLEAARKLQRQGLARHIGFSTHAAPDVIQAAIAADFDYVNLHWYYIYQRNWPCIVEATRRDMGVFIISPTDKGGMLHDPPQRLSELTAPLHPLVFNDLFCLSHPEVHTLSIGAARPSDFDRHLETLPLLPQAQQMLAPILKALEAAYHAAIDSRLRDPFALPLPAWEKTPGEVNVATILWLRNLARAFDLVKYGKMRYNLLGNGGHWFPGRRAENLDAIDFKTLCPDPALASQLRSLLEEAHATLKAEQVQRLSKS
jgi:predicted aldo/keto reductase-like oxidoreductase